ncbi:MAG: phage holin family protein [Actinomycetota bacterium]|nr:phage holin family protein [Actinomycetota bacterium]
MRRMLLTLLSNCAGLALAAAIIPSISYHHRLGTLVLAGLILGLVNVALRPLVILLTLPAVILSFGIALLLVNALMLWVTSRIVSGFQIAGFLATVEGALILWLVNLALAPWKRRRRDAKRARRNRKRARTRNR